MVLFVWCSTSFRRYIARTVSPGGGACRPQRSIVRVPFSDNPVLAEMWITRARKAGSINNRERAHIMTNSWSTKHSKKVNHYSIRKSNDPDEEFLSAFCTLFLSCVCLFFGETGGIKRSDQTDRRRLRCSVAPAKNIYFILYLLVYS